MMHRCFIIRSKEQHQQSTQWVEIIEPKSKEKMYANLETGSCTWDAPEVNILFIYYLLFISWSCLLCVVMLCVNHF